MKNRKILGRLVLCLCHCEIQPKAFSSYSFKAISAELPMPQELLIFEKPVVSKNKRSNFSSMDSIIASEASNVRGRVKIGLSPETRIKNTDKGQKDNLNRQIRQRYSVGYSKAHKAPMFYYFFIFFFHRHFIWKGWSYKLRWGLIRMEIGSSIALFKTQE